VQSSSITALIKAATVAAKRMEGAHATWINVSTKIDRTGVIITTHIGGEEQAYIVMNKPQLAELIRHLQNSLDELK
jgi:hypothetical protein